MTPDDRERAPTSDKTGPGRERDRLLATWLARLDDATATGRAFDRLALQGKLARFTPETLGAATRRAASGREAELVSMALTAFDLPGWRAAFTDAVLAAGLGTAGPDELAGLIGGLIDALDDSEVVWVAAERNRLTPPGLRADLDRCVHLLTDHAEVAWAAAAFVRAVAAGIRPDLSAVDSLLARTTDKFGALLTAFADLDAQLAPLLPLAPSSWAMPPTGAAPLLLPSRIPPLPPPFAFKAGTSAPLPPVPPLEWRSPDGRRTALLAVPRVPPDHRRLYLIIAPADDLTGKAVLLGGLRGVVEVGGRVAFDWDDVVAVGPMVDHLQVGGRVAWTCLSPTNQSG